MGSVLPPLRITATRKSHVREAAYLLQAIGDGICGLLSVGNATLSLRALCYRSPRIRRPSPALDDASVTR